MGTQGVQTLQAVAVREVQVEEHKIDIPACRPVQTGQQGFCPMDLKSTRIRERYFDQFGIARVVFYE
jgi:hypothetical protein